MIDKTHMTIDAYLRQAGLKTVTRTESQKTFIPLKPVSTGFSELLDGAKTSEGGDTRAQTKGKTIADYLNQRPLSGSASFFSHSTLGRGTLTAHYQNALKAALQTATGSDAAAVRSTADSTPPEETALINQSIREAAGKYNLSASLIESVIRTESNFQPDAVSPAGAQGLMQLMPGTARDLGVSDPFDIQQNIDGGSRYLRQMLDRFDGNVKLALAAYNAGPGTVERYNGDVPYRETRNYVRRVLAGLSSATETTA